VTNNISKSNLFQIYMITYYNSSFHYKPYNIIFMLIFFMIIFLLMIKVEKLNVTLKSLNVAIS
jgi:hypothetical protein